MIRALKDHPAFGKTYWINLYNDGGCSGVLSDSALELVQMTDATPVSVRLVLVDPITGACIKNVEPQNPS